MNHVKSTLSNCKAKCQRYPLSRDFDAKNCTTFKFSQCSAFTESSDFIRRCHNGVQCNETFVNSSSSLLVGNDQLCVLFESESSSANDRIFKFPIDTGAAVSLIKTSSIKNCVTDTHNPMVLNGIAPNIPIQTLGETKIELIVHDKSIVGNFQILDAHTNIPFDGLLDDDFLRTHNAKIDYSTSCISFESLPFSISLL